MDYTISPVPRRSLVRRLAPWAASLGLFAGGGYGVYRYAAPGVATAATPSSTNAPSSGSLLASLPGQADSTGTAARYTTPFDPPSARYAAPPTLPPAPDDQGVATPRSAAAVEPPVNPFASLPVDGETNRNDSSPAGLATGATTEVAAPVDALAEPPAAEVARGQEPASVNPLRSGASSPPPATEAAPAAEVEDARAAFGETAAPKASETAPPTGSTASELTPIGDAGRYGAPQGYAQAAEPAEPAVADNAGGATAAPLPMVNPFAAAAGTAARPNAAAPVTPTPTAVSPPPSAASAPYAPSYIDQPGDEAPQVVASATSPTATPIDGAFTPTPGLATSDGTGRPGERNLEGLQSPALSIQKSAPPEIQVGRKCTFYVRVTNTSQRTAQGVVVSDEVPLGTQLIGTTPKATVSGSLVAWDLGTLSPGDERILEMALMPTAEGELGSVATVTFASQAAARTRCTRPQLALRLSANPRVMIGDQQIVQVEVTNPGTGDATGVMLLETIPQGVTHEAGPALEFEVGTLRPGETKRLELVLKANEAGLVDNIMTARADANLQVQANCQFEVIAPALKVSIDGPAKRILERPATYAVKIDNPGTAVARDVQLVTQLPPGMKFVSADHHGEYDATTHSVYWSLAELPANQQGEVQLTTLAVEAGEQTLQVATRAQQGLEDRAETRVLVEGIVALGFEVQDIEDAIEVGGETSYEIRVTNQGSKAATNVQVVAQMPTGLRAHLGQGDARYTMQGNQMVFEPIAQIPPKSDATLRFRVQGLQAGDQRVQLQVTTDEVRNPITEVESTQVYADE